MANLVSGFSEGRQAKPPNPWKESGSILIPNHRHSIPQHSGGSKGEARRGNRLLVIGSGYEDHIPHSLCREIDDWEATAIEK